MYLSRIKQAKKSGANPELVAIEQVIAEHHKLVNKPLEIIAWVFMPNHFHLVVKQNTDNGISEFMHRISTAYTLYINRKHNFSGAVFQGPFKSVSVENEAQLLHVCRYVHLNPLSANLIDKNHLAQYPWSSWSYYMGKNTPHETKTDFVSHNLLTGYFDSLQELEEFTFAPVGESSASILEGTTIDDDFGWYIQNQSAHKARHNDAVKSHLALQ